MPTEALNPVHVAWTKNQVNLLAIGEMWGYPSAGLIFRRVSEDTLALVESMPWKILENAIENSERELDIPRTAVEYAAHQARAIAQVSAHLAAAGFKFEDRRTF